MQHELKRDVEAKGFKFFYASPAKSLGFKDDGPAYVD